MNEMSPEVRVRVRVTSSGRTWSIYLADNDRGIPITKRLVYRA